MRDRLYRPRPDSPWYCSYYDPSGKRIRRCTYCLDRAAARLVARRYEREANDPSCQTANAPTGVTVSKALEDFVNDPVLNIRPATLSMYTQKAGHLKRLLGEMDLAELNIQVVKAYIAKREEEGAARGTVYKELVTLRRCLDVAREAGHYRQSPKAIFPRYTIQYVPRRRWLTPQEFLALLSELDPHRQMWVAVCVFTGCRDSEVDGLRWEDVDWRNHVLTVRGTKTEGAGALIPIHPVLEHVLKGSRQARGHIVGEWNNVRGTLRAACRRAKIDPVSPNDLRRTLASWLIQEGVDAHAVASILRNSARMIEKVYGRHSQASLAAAINRIPGGKIPDDTMRTNLEASKATTPTVSDRGLVEVAEVLTGVVPRDRIELSTRGFSVRAPAQKYLKKQSNSIGSLSVTTLRTKEREK